MVSAEDTYTIPGGAQLRKVTCLHNQGATPLPEGTVNYQVGFSKTDSSSHEEKTTDTRTGMKEWGFEYGFSKIRSISGKATYTHQHETSTVNTQMTSSTQSKQLTLSTPAVPAGKTWCCYSVHAVLQAPQMENLDLTFPVDLLFTEEEIHGGGDIVIHGDKLTFDSPKGYQMTTNKWHDWFMYMQDKGDGNVRGWQGDPGDQGHWRFTKVGNNIFKLRSVKWDDWYMYAQDNKDGNVRAWQGEPGDQGHFEVTQHPTKMCYLLRPVKWSDWFVYMQDDKDGNVRLKEGIPGDEGCWIITEVFASALSEFV